MQAEGETKRKRERGPERSLERVPESASGESDCESLLDEVDSNSPAQNVEEKPKSETPVAPSLLPIAELSRQDESDTKLDNADASIFPSGSPPNTKDGVIADKSPLNLGTNEEEIKNSSGGESKDKEYAENLPMALSKPYPEYDGPSKQGIKLEMDDSPSPDRDEILPPVLTSEESYVPKDEMPTLHASTNLPDSMTTTSSYSSEMNMKYSSGYSQMEMSVDGIKMESGFQSSDENSAQETATQQNMSESVAPRSESPTSFNRQASPPPQQIPYPHMRPESPRQSMEQNQDKVLPPQSVMLPTYIYNENERGDKAMNPSNVPPGSLNLSQHHSAYPYYHFPPHPHADKMEGSPYLGKLLVVSC